MANCDFCKKSVSFFQINSFTAGKSIQGVSVGDTYNLCSDCLAKVNKAKEGDPSAKEEIRRLAESAIDSLDKRKKFFSFINIETTKEDEEIEQRIALKKQQEEERAKYTNTVIEKVRGMVQEYQETHPPLFDLIGCRGRSLEVYTDRIVVTTDVTLGSILTSNATDGKKTIFYQDIVGVQYKAIGLTIGYLQFETASGQMNNKASNQFSENTFTFEDLKMQSTVELVRDYIILQISKFKQPPQ